MYVEACQNFFWIENQLYIKELMSKNKYVLSTPSTYIALQPLVILRYFQGDTIVASSFFNLK